jgi:hypothetical protein
VGGMTTGPKTGACQDLRSQDGGAFRFGFSYPDMKPNFSFSFFLIIYF